MLSLPWKECIPNCQRHHPDLLSAWTFERFPVRIPMLLEQVRPSVPYVLHAYASPSNPVLSFLWTCGMRLFRSCQFPHYCVTFPRDTSDHHPLDPNRLYFLWMALITSSMTPSRILSSATTTTPTTTGLLFFYVILLLMIDNLPTTIAARRPSTALYSHAQHVRDPSSSESEEEEGGGVTKEQQQQQQQHNEKAISNEQSYNWSADQDSMVLAHNAIRKEIKDMKTVLENLQPSCAEDDPPVGEEPLEPSSSWQMDSIREWCKGHDAHVRFHCQNESDHLHPAMSERLKDFPTSQLKQDHEEIHTCLDELMSILLVESSRCWKKAPDDTTATTTTATSDCKEEQLLKLWCKYEATVLSHFQQEEQEGIVSTRQAFSAKEWAPIIKTFFDRGAKEEFGSLIHAMGQDDFRTVFMKQRNIPGFVWRIAFQKNLRYYETTMVRHMDALLSGVPPTTTT
jgi:hypothetical protein